MQKRDYARQRANTGTLLTNPALESVQITISRTKWSKGLGQQLKQTTLRCTTPSLRPENKLNFKAYLIQVFRKSENSFKNHKLLFIISSTQKQNNLSLQVFFKKKNFLQGTTFVKDTYVEKFILKIGRDGSTALYYELWGGNDKDSFEDHHRI